MIMGTMMIGYEGNQDSNIHYKTRVQFSTLKNIMHFVSELTEILWCNIDFDICILSLVQNFTHLKISECRNIPSSEIACC